MWVHGDVAASNLIVAGGRLQAVIDFGCAAVGDPACDLVFAWTGCTDDARTTFRDTLALDDATWARARGWALWKAVITLAQAQQGHLDLDATTRRFGWRLGARELVDLVLDDHRAVRRERHAGTNVPGPQRGSMRDGAIPSTRSRSRCALPRPHRVRCSTPSCRSCTQDGA